MTKHEIEKQIEAKKSAITKLTAEIQGLERQLEAYPATDETKSLLENMDAVAKRYGKVGITRYAKDSD